jgi:hypothetical protein
MDALRILTDDFKLLFRCYLKGSSTQVLKGSSKHFIVLLECILALLQTMAGLFERCNLKPVLLAFLFISDHLRRIIASAVGHILVGQREISQKLLWLSSGLMSKICLSFIRVLILHLKYLLRIILKQFFLRQKGGFHQNNVIQIVPRSGSGSLVTRNL